MTAPNVNYPTGLPLPTRSLHTPAGRVTTSDLPGFHQYLNRQQDYSGDIDVEFFFDSTQIATFFAWWKTDTLEGGRWFNCSWPALRTGAMVAQFQSAPVFKHVYNGAYRVTAKVQIRGATQAVIANGDPYLSYVTVLMNFQGTAGSSTIVDESPLARTVTNTSNHFLLSSAQSPFGGTSVKGDGVGSLKMASLPATLLSGDFTVEAWVYWDTAPGANQGIATWQRIGGSDVEMEFYRKFSTGFLTFYDGGNRINGITTVTNNAWHYCVLKRTGGVVYMEMDLIAQGNYTTSAIFGVNTGPRDFVASYSDSSETMTGYMGAIRVTNGICRDTSILPTALFPTF